MEIENSRALNFAWLRFYALSAKFIEIHSSHFFWRNEKRSRIRGHPFVLAADQSPQTTQQSSCGPRVGSTKNGPLAFLGRVPKLDSLSNFLQLQMADGWMDPPLGGGVRSPKSSLRREAEYDPRKTRYEAILYHTLSADEASMNHHRIRDSFQIFP